MRRKTGIPVTPDLYSTAVPNESVTRLDHSRESRGTVSSNCHGPCQTENVKWTPDHELSIKECILHYRKDRKISTVLNWKEQGVREQRGSQAEQYLQPEPVLFRPIYFPRLCRCLAIHEFIGQRPEILGLPTHMANLAAGILNLQTLQLESCLATHPETA